MGIGGLFFDLLLFNLLLLSTSAPAMLDDLFCVFFISPSLATLLESEKQPKMLDNKAIDDVVVSIKLISNLQPAKSSKDLSP